MVPSEDDCDSSSFSFHLGKGYALDCLKVSMQRRKCQTRAGVDGNSLCRRDVGLEVETVPPPKETTERHPGTLTYGGPLTHQLSAGVTSNLIFPGPS